MDKEERQKEMQSLVEQWQQSDYSQREFARMHHELEGHRILPPPANYTS